MKEECWVIQRDDGMFLSRYRTVDGVLLYFNDLNLAQIFNNKNTAIEDAIILGIEGYVKPVKVEIRVKEEV